MLATWDPFRDMARAQDEFSRVWGTTRTAAGFTPSVNIHEDEGAYALSVELPGLKKEELEIEVDGGVLILKGEKKFESEKSEKGFHLVERRYGKFTRRFSLPETVNADGIEASMADGILTLTIPKIEAPKPKRISVS